MSAGPSVIDRLGRPKPGKPAFLTAAELAAAQRLIADFELASRQAPVTQDWRFEPKPDKGAGHGPDIVLDGRRRARQRLDAAMQTLSGGQDSLIIGVLLRGEGLERAERRRGWPPRMAKHVVKMALFRLACLYGLAQPQQSVWP